MADVRPAHMKVICPTANKMPVSLNGGFQMNSWFDIKSLDNSGPEDEQGIKDAAKLVHGLIGDEIKAGIPAQRIMLGGFSQGGALALYAGLTLAEPLAGLIAFSCWLPLHASFPAARKTAESTPILQCHGDADPVVTYKMGQLSAQALKIFMTNTKFETYRGMSHSSSPDELEDLKVACIYSMLCTKQIYLNFILFSVIYRELYSVTIKVRCDGRRFFFSIYSFDSANHHRDE